MVAKQIVTYISPDTSFKILVLMMIIYGFLWLCNQLILVFREMVMIPASERIISYLSRSVLKKLYKLPFREHARLNTGEIIGQMKRTQIAVPNIIWGLCFFVFPPVIEILGAVLILVTCHYYATASILLGTFILFFLYTFFSSKKSISLHDESLKKDGQVGAKLSDSLLNIETIKSFSTEKLEFSRFTQNLEEREKAEIKNLMALEKARLVQVIILGIGFILTLVSTLLFIHRDRFFIGEFVMINGFLMQFFTPMSFLTIIFRNLFRGFRDVDHLFKYLKGKHDDPRTNFEEKSNEAKEILPIEFNAIDFSYVVGNPVLKSISIKIEKGDKVAFVGPIGSGKSTVSRLLLKLCDPDCGTISYNGKTIEKYSKSELAEYIGIVPQNTEIFNDTLAFNLSYGSEMISTEQIERVIRNLSLSDLVTRLPSKIETVLGEKGSTLSGGQRQAIGIARVLIKNPQIVILDEITSSLDAKTEAAIQEMIHTLFQEKTVITISHKLSQITHCNKIFVLENGLLIESGNHQSLLNKKGLYSHLWSTQSEK